ncbi:hypothetical protein H4582DRAFT_2107504 [Lactarius indigo]|nr:hypothetical protein H4582DRAFT_2107504 [Lactarius indigo]
MPSSSRLTPSWRGFINIRKLIVFGDSFSYIGYSSRSPVPTSSSPLGVAFPGQPVTEPTLPNWLGYLVRDYGHGHANMIAYDYARRGDTVTGVSRDQVSREFLPSVGRRPSWAPWGPSDTLFGIYTNDKAEITPIIASMFAAQDMLYSAGARNFLFIDVPPLYMSPIGVRFGNWNDELGRWHPDATLSRILSDPARYGFNPADRYTQGGSIWYDYMHPTSRVHSILASEIAQFLASLPPQA